MSYIMNDNDFWSGKPTTEDQIRIDAIPAVGDISALDLCTDVLNNQVTFRKALKYERHYRYIRNTMRYALVLIQDNALMDPEHDIPMHHGIKVLRSQNQSTMTLFNLYRSDPVDPVDEQHLVRTMARDSVVISHNKITESLAHIAACERNNKGGLLFNVPNTGEWAGVSVQTIFIHSRNYFAHDYGTPFEFRNRSNNDFSRDHGSEVTSLPM